MEENGSEMHDLLSNVYTSLKRTYLKQDFFFYISGFYAQCIIRMIKGTGMQGSGGLKASLSLLFENSQSCNLF